MIKMENTRNIIKTFIEMLQDELTDEGKKIVEKLNNTIKRADLRKNYYRLKIWKLLIELGNTGSEMKTAVDNLLSDLAQKWENTMAKALDKGILPIQ